MLYNISILTSVIKISENQKYEYKYIMLNSSVFMI